MPHSSSPAPKLLTETGQSCAALIKGKEAIEEIDLNSVKNYGIK